MCVVCDARRLIAQGGVKFGMATSAKDLRKLGFNVPKGRHLDGQVIFAVESARGHGKFAVTDAEVREYFADFLGEIMFCVHVPCSGPSPHIRLVSSSEKDDE